jgi:hypothetical protein
MKKITSFKSVAMALLLTAFCLLPTALFGQIASIYQPNTTEAVQSWGWSATTVGVSATAVNFTLMNTGGATLTLSSISITGTNTGDWSVATTPGSVCGGSLTAGSTCTLAVTFTPQAAGARSASLSIADNATGSPQVVLLTGTGSMGGAAAGSAYSQFLSEYTLPALTGAGTSATCMGCSSTSTQTYGAGVVTIGVTQTQIAPGNVTLSGGALSNCAPPAYSSCGFIYWPGSGSSLSFTNSFNTADAAGNVIVTLMTTNASNVPVAAFPFSGQSEISPQLFELSTASISPAATSAAIQTVGQAFTLTGIASGEYVTLIGQPAPTSLCPATSARATGSNSVTLYFTVLTAAACTPAAGVYTFLAIR